MDLGEVGWDDVDWIVVAQDKDKWRVVLSAVINLRIPYNAGKLSSGLTNGGLSGSAQLHTTDDQGAHIRYYTYETKYIYIRYTHMHLTIPYETTPTMPYMSTHATHYRTTHIHTRR
jgi:hypothetical protein